VICDSGLYAGVNKTVVLKVLFGHRKRSRTLAIRGVIQAQAKQRDEGCLTKHTERFGRMYGVHKGLLLRRLMLNRTCSSLRVGRASGLVRSDRLA